MIFNLPHYAGKLQLSVIIDTRFVEGYISLYQSYIATFNRNVKRGDIYVLDNLMEISSTRNDLKIFPLPKAETK